FKSHPERGFDSRPMIEYPCDRVSAILTVPNGPINGVSDPYVRKDLCPPIGHQDRSVASHTVNTGVRTPPIHVDGPLERHAAGRRDPVEDGLGLDLVEGEVAELGAVEGAHRRRGVEEGQVGGWPGLTPQVGEGPHGLTLERVFGWRKDAREAVESAWRPWAAAR